MPADAQTQARKNEQDVFGVNPARASDGKPLERGVGSAWNRMRPSERTHYLVVEAQASVDAVIAQAKALADAATKLAESFKPVAVEAAKAKDEPIPPSPPVAETPAERDRRLADASRTFSANETSAQRDTRLAAEGNAGRLAGIPSEQRAARLASLNARIGSLTSAEEAERQQLAAQA